MKNQDLKDLAAKMTDAEWEANTKWCRELYGWFLENGICTEAQAPSFGPIEARTRE